MKTNSSGDVEWQKEISPSISLNALDVYQAEDTGYVVIAGVSYTAYLGFGNNIGQSSYYTCYIKIINETESAPNTSLGRPSEISGLYEHKLFVTDGEKMQSPLTFQIKKLTFENLTCSLSGIQINGVDIPISKNSEWPIRPKRILLLSNR